MKSVLGLLLSVVLVLSSVTATASKAKSTQMISTMQMMLAQGSKGAVNWCRKLPELKAFRLGAKTSEYYNHRCQRVKVGQGHYCQLTMVVYLTAVECNRKAMRSLRHLERLFTPNANEALPMQTLDQLTAFQHTVNTLSHVAKKMFPKKRKSHWYQQIAIDVIAHTVKLDFKIKQIKQAVLGIEKQMYQHKESMKLKKHGKKMQKHHKKSLHQQEKAKAAPIKKPAKNK